MSKFSNVRTPAPKAPARAPRPDAKPAASERRSGNRARYTPLTVYIDKPVYQAFKARLAFEDRQFSDVLTELMRVWVSERPQI